MRRRLSKRRPLSPCAHARLLPGLSSRRFPVRRETKHPSSIMTTPATHSVRFHRVLKATPERIYRAFLDPDAMVKWLPPNGFTGKVHHLDAKVGGTYKMSFTNFTSKKSH